MEATATAASAAASTSTSPSTRFTPLSTHHLSALPLGSETTLPSLLETSERLAEEAREALPYSFDECTYSKGYLRQAVWSCIDCGEKGVCYGCSISCHAEHKLVELWTKRHFRCDCPTTSIPPTTTLLNGKRRRCTLNPPEIQPQSPNEENRYSRNFAGKFCRCGRDYDPETETEAMLNCIACEDWFHESCLNLRQPPNTSTAQPKEEQQQQANLVEDDDDEDEEKTVLIPSETYDGLICAECVGSHPFLLEKRGSEGWMIIEPRNDGSGGGYDVVGRRFNGQTEGETIEEKDRDGGPILSENGVKQEKGDTKENVNGKREAEEAEDEDERAGKKARIEEGPSDHDSNTLENKALTHELPKGETSKAQGMKGKGDIFLAYGIREHLKATLSPKIIAGLPFPLTDEEIYEPPQEEDEPEETLDDITSRVVGQLPRVQAIEALHGYQTMKDKLKTMLAAHAQDGRSVSREDIEGFFEQLRSGAR